MKPCCTPSRQAGADTPMAESSVGLACATGDRREAVYIPGGTALIGTHQPCLSVDGEGPLREQEIAPFYMDATAVTNARFQTFLSETGYTTEAERFGDSLVFQGLLPKGTPPSRAVTDAPWWRQIPGANWRDTVGPSAPANMQAEHPVVHVSWNDANAFATWAGGRLPTEVQWEHAARGGLGDVRFPWGDQEPDDTGFYPCNIWQGRFPRSDLGLDGYRGTAPAKSYEPNGYGLFNMVGNVWEWTSERFKVDYSDKEVLAAHAGKQEFMLSKGGSFLCHRSYCYRYRIAARNSSSHDTTTSHFGFRLVYDEG